MYDWILEVEQEEASAGPNKGSGVMVTVVIVLRFVAIIAGGGFLLFFADRDGESSRLNDRCDRAAVVIDALSRC